MPHTTALLLLLALAGAAISSPIVHVEPRQAGNFSGDTQNFSGGCQAMMVVFARGTTETGNVGTLTGPPFFQALEQQVGAGNLAVQGVDYPADIKGFLAGGDSDGAQSMAKTVQKTIAQCPQSKVMMSGYSQGGQLVHNAAKAMDSATSSKVAGAIIFGDPDNGQAVQGVSAAKTKVICHQGDNICQGGDLVLQAHLTYSQDANTAATFAKGL